MIENVDAHALRYGGRVGTPIPMRAAQQILAFLIHLRGILSAKWSSSRYPAIIATRGPRSTLATIRRRGFEYRTAKSFQKPVPSERRSSMKMTMHWPSVMLPAVNYVEKPRSNWTPGRRWRGDITMSYRRQLNKDLAKWHQEPVRMHSSRTIEIGSKIVSQRRTITVEIASGQSIVKQVRCTPTVNTQRRRNLRTDSWWTLYHSFCCGVDRACLARPVGESGRN
jgi:hypothetical protein